MEKLVPIFKKSIFDSAGIDIGADILELGIDSVLDDGALKEIPFFGIFLGAVRTAKSIRERNLLRNTAQFIDALNAKQISAEKLLKHKVKLQDEQWAEKELGRVMVLLDRYIDTAKSRILAIFYRKYVEEEFGWKKFCELSDMLDRLFLEDSSFLKTIAEAPESTVNYHIYKIPYNLKRLEGIGLVELFGEYARFGDRLLQSENMCAQLTENGRVFLNVFCMLDVM